MLLDLVHRQLDEILVDLGAQRIAQVVGIGLPQHAQRARRRHDDQRLRIAAVQLGLEMADELLQEPIFFLRMQIGLLHRAASRPDRAERAARRIGPELVGLRIGMLEDLTGLEIEEFFVADVLQH
jgi:hypothetical protein